jgi:hypothetical protein
MSYVQNILMGSSTCEHGAEEVALNKPELVLDATFVHVTQQRSYSHSDKEYHFCSSLLGMLR